MIKIYEFDHWGSGSSCRLKIDTSKFTKKIAKDNLEFFVWDYDKEADPIDECARKYAIEIIHVATCGNFNVFGVKDEFTNKEGFYPLDGTSGIELLVVEAIELLNDDFQVKITPSKTVKS